VCVSYRKNRAPTPYRDLQQVHDLTKEEEKANSKNQNNKSDQFIRYLIPNTLKMFNFVGKIKNTILNLQL
jgi:hypothetical protein